MKRSLCILLAGCLLLALCSCGEAAPALPSQPETQPVTALPETVRPESITLPYNQSASLDPFSTTSRINADLASLVYESLVYLDDTWMPQPQLAASFVLQESELVVTLREDAVFSDGSAVTAADVIYSFGKAAAGAQYRAAVNVLAACRAQGDNSVVFTLRRNDENAAAALTFPIVKKPAKNNRSALLTGSGPYVLVQEAGSASLLPNTHRQPVAAAAVQLYHVEREDMLLHALESGRISYYFDTLSDGSLPRSVKAGLSADMPYLVFLGINGYSVADPAARAALSAMVDRTALAQGAYKGYARAAVTPFHPLWKRTGGLYTFSAVAAGDKAAVLLEEAGYRGGADSKKKKSLSLELIYVIGNPFKKSLVEQLVEQAAAANIALKPVALEYSEYLARLQSGNYQLYLGEVRLSHVSDLSPVLTGQAAFGIRWDSAAAAAFGQYSNGTGSLNAFLEAFAAEMPFVPLCYRKGQALFSRSLGALAPLANNVYYRLDQWTVS